MKQTYVLDTSVLLHNPDVLFKLRGAEIVVPAAVIKELDRLKKHPNAEDPRAKAARKVVRNLDRLGNLGDISNGVKTMAGSEVRVTRKYDFVDDLQSTVDNRIAGAAILLKKKTESHITVLSNDINLRNIVRSYGINAAAYLCSPKDSAGIVKRRAKASMPENEQNAGSLKGKGLQITLVLVVAAILFALLMKTG